MARAFAGDHVLEHARRAGPSPVQAAIAQALEQVFRIALPSTRRVSSTGSEHHSAFAGEMERWVGNERYRTRQSAEVPIQRRHRDAEQRPARPRGSVCGARQRVVPARAHPRDDHSRAANRRARQAPDGHRESAPRAACPAIGDSTRAPPFPMAISSEFPEPRRSAACERCHRRTRGESIELLRFCASVSRRMRRDRAGCEHARIDMVVFTGIEMLHRSRGSTGLVRIIAQVRRADVNDPGRPCRRSRPCSTASSPGWQPATRSRLQWAGPCSVLRPVMQAPADANSKPSCGKLTPHSATRYLLADLTLEPSESSSTGIASDVSKPPSGG